MKMTWNGVMPAITTPFTVDGEVDHDFLARHAGLGREPATGAVPAALLTAEGDFQSLPQRHGMDGAYAARLVRAR